MSKYHTRDKYGRILATVDGEVFTGKVLGKTYSFGYEASSGTITELSSGWRVCDVPIGSSRAEVLHRAIHRSPTGFIKAIRLAPANLAATLPPLPIL